jgi:hypothetical protein
MRALAVRLYFETMVRGRRITAAQREHPQVGVERRQSPARVTTLHELARVGRPVAWVQ